MNVRFARVSASDRKNTLGLSAFDLEVLLNQMDEADAMRKGKSKRTFSRWPFRHPSIAVDMQHPGGSTVSLRLPSRNISRQGVSLLHNAFVYNGTKCVVTLSNVDGLVIKSRGVVMRCQHHQGRIHEVGIQFEKSIRLAEYVTSTNGVALTALEAVDSSKLVGTLLHVEQSDIDARIVPHYLSGSGVRIAHVRTVDEAMTSLASPADVVLLAWQLGPVCGLELIKRMREKSIKVPVIVSTTDPLAVVASTQGLGDIGVLPIPFTQDQILITIGERLLIAKEDSADRA